MTLLVADDSATFRSRVRRHLDQDLVRRPCQSLSADAIDKADAAALMILTLRWLAAVAGERRQR